MSSNTSNSDENHSLVESRRTKRRRISSDSDLGQSSSSSTTTANTLAEIRWTSPSAQHSYSSKLLEALRHVRRRNPPSGSSAVRAAADTALAAAAKGRTRWSRAVLSRRTKLLLKNHRKAAKLRPKFPPANETRRKLSDKPKSLPAVERKVKVLGRLVPGCRKLPFQNLLEEATDYIAALQMQVRAMAALADLLAGSSEPSTSSSSSSSNNPVGPVQMS